jgi:hypothetical protein
MCKVILDFHWKHWLPLRQIYGLDALVEAMSQDHLELVRTSSEIFIKLRGVCTLLRLNIGYPSLGTPHKVQVLLEISSATIKVTTEFSTALFCYKDIDNDSKLSFPVQCGIANIISATWSGSTAELILTKEAKSELYLSSPVYMNSATRNSRRSSTSSVYSMHSPECAFQSSVLSR